MVLLRARRRPRAALAVALALTGALAVPAPAPVAAQAVVLELTVDPLFPTTVVLGQAGEAQLRVSATAASGVTGVELTSITLNPACGTLDLNCPVPDPGTFDLGPAATGTAGACAGQAFTLVGPDGTGRVAFVAASPVVLAPPGAPTSSCTVTFPFLVRKLPAFDALPASPGLQTAHVATVTGSGRQGTALTGQTVGRGLQTSSVVRAQPSIRTRASGPVAAGGAIADTATVTSPANPTGTVTFAAYGPDNPTCAGAPAFTSTNPLTGTFAASDTFTAAAPGRYRFVATYNGDANNAPVAGACADPAEFVDVGGAVPEGTFHALTPARIFDSRDGPPVAGGTAVAVPVTGRGGVPASGAVAVALNVTVTQPTEMGYLTLFAGGAGLPLASNVNFAPGQDIANLVVVPVGAGGTVAAYNSAGSTHVVLDVAGWFSTAAGGAAGRYRPLVPARILDTRDGTGGGARLGPNQSLELQVAGAGGVPAAGAGAAVLNIVATATTATSFVTAYPSGSAPPGVSNLNFGAGATVANRAMVKLGAGGRVTIYNLAGQADIVVDVAGWFTDGSAPAAGGGFVATGPARVLDTRDGTGGLLGARPAGAAVEVQVTGRGGVPASGVSAVVLNLTATEPAGGSYLTVFPAGHALPLASDLNFEAGATRSNLAVVRVGAGGKVTLFAPTATHVVLDVQGWFHQ